MEDRAGNSAASLKEMCLCLAREKLRATDTRSVYRSAQTNKGNEPELRNKERARTRLCECVRVCGDVFPKVLP